MLRGGEGREEGRRGRKGEGGTVAGSEVVEDRRARGGYVS